MKRRNKNVSIHNSSTSSIFIRKHKFFSNNKQKMAGFDVREKGSGNAGATNMLRSVGKKEQYLH